MAKGEIRLLPDRVGRKPIDTPDRRAMMAKSAALQEELLWERRGKLVHIYRANPRLYPDGIDTKYDRWYRPEDWVEAEDSKTCVYVGPPRTAQPPVTKTVTKTPPVTETKRKGGRPKKADAMTSAERMAKLRKLRKQPHEDKQ